MDLSIRAHLFGRLHILCQDEPLPLPPFRTHGLLVALLLYPQLRHRHQWVGLLFPDMSEAAGRRRLSDLLYLLRRDLPMLPLEVGRDSLYLPASERWLDVEAFLEAGAREGLAHRLEALRLYQGDLLDGYYDDWLLEEREYLRLQYVHLAHRASESLIERRRFDEARPLLERLIQEEPFDENALRWLMQVYQALGRRGTALAAYEHFVALAADELGVEPEMDTQDLARSIQQASPGVPASPVDPLSVPDGASGEELLDLARLALQRGERAVVEMCLAALSGRFPGEFERESCLLQVDLALFFEEYDEAERWLQSCDAGHRQVLLRRAALARRRRRWARAGELAAEALMAAHQAGDSPAEVGALLVLGYARSQQGEYAQALRSVERALRLARAQAGPYEIARALVLLGRLLVLQSQQDRAGGYLEEALSLAREHRLPYQEGCALRWLAGIRLSDGEPLEAKKAYERSLDIWRGLGLPRMEALILQEMAEVADHLGQTAEGIRLMEQAQAIRERLDEPVGLAICRYNLAYALLWHSDALAADAAEIAQESLATFAAHGQQGWVAAALLVLGYARWVSGRYQEALPVLQESYRRHEELQELKELPEVLTHMTMARLGLGQVEEALDCTRRALLQLAQEVLPEAIVSEAYCAHALALAAGGDEAQAEKYFQRAYEVLLRVASQLRGNAARQAFFHRNPITRLLMRELYRRGMAGLSFSGVVNRQMPGISGEAAVEGAWVLDAEPVNPAHGAADLRRIHLQRLLQKSRTQGVQPSIAHLAEVLGVSVRTVRRDMASLRNA